MSKSNARRDTAQLVRYLASGAATFGVEYGSFLVFVYACGLAVHLSLVLSFLLALATGFAFSHLWTFERDDAQVQRRFWAFAALALVNLCFNYFAVPGLHDLGIPYAVGKVMTQSCVVVWNYVLMSRIIFRSRPVTAG